MERIYKEASRKGGIYKITNKINGKFYIGSTWEFKTRWDQHEKQLIENKHKNIHLQNAFNHYGAEAFVFEVIKIIEIKQDRLDAEQKLLDQFWDNCQNCYNTRKEAVSREGSKDKFKRVRSIGSHTPKETKTKFLESMQGKFGKLAGKTYEEQMGIEAAKLRKEKQSNALKGKIVSEETKEKLRKANKGKKPPQKAIERSREVNSQRFGMKSPRAKIYENLQLQAPTGEIIVKIECLSEFCRNNKLHLKHFTDLLKGKCKIHKGWINLNRQKSFKEIRKEIQEKIAFIPDEQIMELYHLLMTFDNPFKTRQRHAIDPLCQTE